MLLASKFSTVKIECSFVMGQVNTFRSVIYIAGDGSLSLYIDTYTILILSKYEYNDNYCIIIMAYSTTGLFNYNWGLILVLRSTWHISIQCAPDIIFHQLASIYSKIA